LEWTTYGAFLVMLRSDFSDDQSATYGGTTITTISVLNKENAIYLLTCKKFKLVHTFHGQIIMVLD
jgi:hypothetical protein